MSRIAGLLAREPELNTDGLLQRLAQGLSDRGQPHSAGAGASRGRLVWCGHHAPARIAERGSLSAVLDGRLFGHTLESALELFERVGMRRMLDQLDGEFAIAILDDRREELWLARDRFGIKPLYYTAGSGGIFAFASRPRALLALPGIDTGLNPRFVGLAAAAHYRSLDNRPHESPYRAIAQLPARHFLHADGTGRVAAHRYWDLQDQPDAAEDAVTLAHDYRERLFEAVRSRLAGASAPRFTLSGGMDSSSVLASAALISGTPQIAYSTVYADSTYDESDDIQPMLDERVSEWRRVAVDDPDVFALVAEMVVAHDEPVATATWLSHYLLCRQAARDGVDVLFGGLGGDELNAGEYEYFFFHFADLKAAGRDADLAREIDGWVRHHDHPIFRKSAAVAQDGLERLVDPATRGRIRPDRRRLERYAAALKPECLDLATFEHELDHPFQSYLKNRTYQDLFRETAPCCLRAQDRHAAAFGLEHAMPFLDYKLAEFMFRVPNGLKIANGVTKVLLRDAMAGVLPEPTRTRIKKTGWNAPAHRWFSGDGAEPLLDLLHDQAFRERGIYDAATVIAIAREHGDIVARGLPIENHMMFLWQVVNLELWLRHVERSLPVPEPGGVAAE